ncbi:MULTISPECIES: acyltransferase domain-containing protein [Bacillus cereus group]|uniref:Polyketide biosynthesis acyltransferase PksD n=1 Tax=Bacillus cytotoxicus TaxID=580165 RepID=A0AAX2CL77_9BACI|nr:MULTISPECIES: acyltransferase domain-containing protein [Bacillus cereus group]AWC30014.1 acyltransferase [Bacillus cytotoxicus]AWC42150.1 acyltransferase [Bacillus cytotoxicus]AWC50081.1 acyltransferase [Bacillus cytotoxicus]AWC54138.1 acyltransferase [Bacillus cytotoxicus]AWC58263.1 acyltransferase [Bacillus cytotoxicus]
MIYNLDEKIKKKVVFLFSGQGSQYYQMGKELFFRFNRFQEIVMDFDRIVQDWIGKSAVEELYGTKQVAHSFTETMLTHPSIFIVEYALARFLIESGIKPDYVVGTSLGEFTALAVSQVMTPESALACVLKQAQLVERDCEPGNMLLIQEDVSLFYETDYLYCRSDLAGIQSNHHFVISVVKQNMKEIEQFLRLHNINYYKLPISHAFHSTSMEVIANEYKKFLSKIKYNKVNIPLVSSVDGQMKKEISSDYLWEVTRKPIYFCKAICTLQKICSDAVFLDLGPGGTLHNSLRYIGNQNTSYHSFPLMKPYQNAVCVEQIKEWIR